MDLTADTGGIKERDLSRAPLERRARRTAAARPRSCSYDLPMKELLEIRERGGDLDEDFELDFPIKFARDFVAHVQPGKRPDAGAASQAVHRRTTRRAELDKVAAELKQHRQSTGATLRRTSSGRHADAYPPGVEVKVETDRPDNEVTAGEPMNLKVTVTNKGADDALPPLRGRRRATTRCSTTRSSSSASSSRARRRRRSCRLGWCEVEGPQDRLDGAELPKDAPRACTIPKDTLMRADGVTVHFEEARGRAPADAEIRDDGQVARAAGLRLLATRSSTTARATATAASRRARG